ncbi:MAG: sensor histidine kinase [Sphingobacteriaceae bacterium]|nr:MAG: sensor histidine kinase [Sphingobacteriaceae bacterium]
MSEINLPDDEAQRIEALNSYNILDSLPQKDFDDITCLASEICNVPISLITFVDDKRQWFKSKYGLDISETPREYAFCSHAIASGEEIFTVSDAHKDERFANNPLTVGHPQVVFYTGVPLINEDGHALGTLCVIDNKPNQLTENQIKALKALANQVLAQLELRRKVKELNSLTLELQKSNEYLERFAVMASHDIKSPLTSIMLTGQMLKSKYQQNLDAKGNQMLDIINSSANRLLNFLNKMLEYSKSYKVLLQKKDEICINELIQEVLKLVTIPESFRIETPADLLYIKTSAIALEQILINLLNNAVRYNDKSEGFIRLEFEEKADFYQFRISDNGIGIEEKNFDKIFEPMITLNSRDRYNKAGSGIGLSTVKNLIDSLGGEIQVESVLSEGTTFQFTIQKQ